MDRIDIDNLIIKHTYHVGTLKQGIIDILGLGISPCDVLFTYERILYAKKHEVDYSTRDEFKKHLEAVNDILDAPNYIGIHPDGKSIRFVKKIDKFVLVPIGIKKSGPLFVKTSYPLADDKLLTYVENGRLYEMY